MSTGTKFKVSIVNTPQAKDDSGLVQEDGAFISIEGLLSNDLGGAAKTFYGFDQETPTNGSDSESSEYTFLGAKLTLEADPVTGEMSLYYDAGLVEAIQGLSDGATLTDSFTYTIRMANGTLSTATVSLTITGSNDGPVAVADIAAGGENDTLTIDVLANDTDADDGAAFTLTAASAPEGKGTATIVDNKLVFTPGTAFDHLAAGATETVVVSYTMTDEHGAESVSTVEVTITGSNDGPVAAPASQSGAEDTVITGSVSATDIDGENLTYRLLRNAQDANGNDLGGLTFGADGSYSFTGPTDFHGTVTFTFVASDGDADSEAQTVTLTVTPVNDAPVTQNANASGPEDSVIEINFGGDDLRDYLVGGQVFGEELVTGFRIDDLPDTGTLALNADGTGIVMAGDVVPAIDGTQVAKLYFLPAANWNGITTFHFTAIDVHGAEASNQGLGRIHASPVNDAPEAAPDTTSVGENVVAYVDVLANDTDPDGGAVLSLVSVTGPQGKGTASAVGGKVAFDPGTDFDHLAAGETEVVILNYTVVDEHGSEATGSVTLTIAGANDIPQMIAESTMTFSDVAAQADVVYGTHYNMNEYSEDGFTLRNSDEATWGPNALYAPKSAADPYWSGSEGIYSSLGYTSNYVTKDDGGRFGVASLDIDTAALLAQTITITGTKVDGSLVSHVFVPDRVRG